MEEDDEDIRAAIAASLADQARGRRGRAPPAEIVDLTEDDDEDMIEEDESEEARFERELLAALEVSKKQAPMSPAPAPVRAVPPEPAKPVITNGNASHAPAASPSPAPAPDVPASSFLSERAQLEQARLARQKRHLDELARTQATKRSRTVSPVPSPTTSPPSSPEIPRAKPPPPKPVDTTAPNHGLFYDGEIRQTGNEHVKEDRARPVFRITDILSPTSDLEFIVLSSYCTDVPWLLTLIPEGIPLLLVVDPPEDARGHSGLKNLGLPGWLKVIPRMWQSIGVMHIKLMLLFYKSGRLRVVVPTANLVDYDWRDIENTVFLQDLKPVPEADQSDREPHEFPVYLWAVLNALNVPEGLNNLVNTGYPHLPMQSLHDLQTKWDWSRLKAKLVASIAGKYEGWYEVRKYGHPRLAATIREIGAQPPRGKILQLECQGSSVGNYTTQYLNEVYKSACGEDPIKWIDMSKTRLAKQPWPPIKILFPTLATVDASVFGRVGGGSFFCRKNYWSKAGAPRELFYDARAKGGNVLMHTKMIVGTYKAGPLHAGLSRQAARTTQSASKGKGKEVETIVIDSDSETEIETEDEVEEVAPEAWIYVGSHNFTMAAWGSVSGGLLAPKLNISNSEMGVVLPIRDKNQLERIVPWVRPATKYGKNDVPWMQDEHRDQTVPTWRELNASD